MPTSPAHVVALAERVVRGVVHLQESHGLVVAADQVGVVRRQAVVEGVGVAQLVAARPPRGPRTPCRARHPGVDGVEVRLGSRTRER